MKCPFCNSTVASGDQWCASCGFPLRQENPERGRDYHIAPAGEIRCSACSMMNSASNSFCYYCGEVLGKGAVIPVPPPAVTAALVLPFNKQLRLEIKLQAIGRENFDGIVDDEKLTFISRRSRPQFFISYENGDFYIEDQKSANGTRLNDIEIKGIGMQKLSDGDRINVGGVVTVQFKATREAVRGG